jgi:hypothetical protein
MQSIENIPDHSGLIDILTKSGVYLHNVRKIGGQRLILALPSVVVSVEQRQHCTERNKES